MAYERGSILHKVIIAVLGLIAGVVILYGAVALAAHIPTVTITSPSNGEDVSGIINVTCEYSVGGGSIHSLYMVVEGVEIDSIQVNSKEGTHTFTLDTSMYPNGNIDITIESFTAAKPSGHSSDDTITVNVVNAVCSDDSDCDDLDDYTADSCDGPGTAEAACLHEDIACINDIDCDDGSAITTDNCDNPGTVESSCLNVSCDIACSSNTDCDDLNQLTTDLCVSPGTCEAECTNDACNVECESAADCDDGDEITMDSCEGEDTCDAVCSNVACEVACSEDSNCDDSNSLTIDTCNSAGTCEAECGHTPTTCNVNSDCDDSNALTIDVCLEGGMETAQCLNTPIACNTDEDCDDGDSITSDACTGGSTEGAACVNTPCEVVCDADSDCDDFDSATNDTCTSPGKCEAACVNELMPVEPEPEPEPLELILDIPPPVDGPITNIPTVTVEGITTPGATVTINGIDTINTDGAFSETITLNEGTNEITVIASLEGDSLTETIDVILDTIPPSVISTDPADGAEFEITLDLISIRIEDNSGGTGLDSSTIYASLDAVELPGNWNAGASTYEATGIEIAPGYHTLTVTASDNAGNQLVETITFVKQGKSPKVKILSVPGHEENNKVEITEEETPLLGVLTAMIEPGEIPLDENSIEIAINGESVSYESDESGLMLTSAMTLEEPGLYDVRVLASDTDGNESEASESFEVVMLSSTTEPEVMSLTTTSVVGTEITSMDGAPVTEIMMSGSGQSAATVQGYQLACTADPANGIVTNTTDTAAIECTLTSTAVGNPPVEGMEVELSAGGDAEVSLTVQNPTTGNANSALTDGSGKIYATLQVTYDPGTAVITATVIGACDVSASTSVDIELGQLCQLPNCPEVPDPATLPTASSNCTPPASGTWSVTQDTACLWADNPGLDLSAVTIQVSNGARLHLIGTDAATDKIGYFKLYDTSYLYIEKVNTPESLTASTSDYSANASFVMNNVLIKNYVTLYGTTKGIINNSELTGYGFAETSHSSQLCIKGTVQYGVPNNRGNNYSYTSAVLVEDSDMRLLTASHDSNLTIRSSVCSYLVRSRNKSRVCIYDNTNLTDELQIDDKYPSDSMKVDIKDSFIENIRHTATGKTISVDGFNPDLHQPFSHDYYSYDKSNGNTLSLSLHMKNVVVGSGGSTGLFFSLYGDTELSIQNSWFKALSANGNSTVSVDHASMTQTIHMLESSNGQFSNMYVALGVPGNSASRVAGDASARFENVTIEVGTGFPEHHVIITDNGNVYFENYKLDHSKHSLELLNRYRTTVTPTATTKVEVHDSVLNQVIMRADPETYPGSTGELYLSGVSVESDLYYKGRIIMYSQNTKLITQDYSGMVNGFENPSPVSVMGFGLDNSEAPGGETPVVKGPLQITRAITNVYGMLFNSGTLERYYPAYVHDPDGNPLAGHTVCLVSDPANPVCEGIPAVTDADGRAEPGIIFNTSNYTNTYYICDMDKGECDYNNSGPVGIGYTNPVMIDPPGDGITLGEEEPETMAPGERSGEMFSQAEDAPPANIPGHSNPSIAFSRVERGSGKPVAMNKAAYSPQNFHGRNYTGLDGARLTYIDNKGKAFHSTPGSEDLFDSGSAATFSSSEVINMYLVWNDTLNAGETIYSQLPQGVLNAWMRKNLPSGTRVDFYQYATFTSDENGGWKHRPVAAEKMPFAGDAVETDVSINELYGFTATEPGTEIEDVAVSQDATSVFVRDWSGTLEQEFGGKDETAYMSTAVVSIFYGAAEDGTAVTEPETAETMPVLMSADTMLMSAPLTAPTTMSLLSTHTDLCVEFISPAAGAVESVIKGQALSVEFKVTLETDPSGSCTGYALAPEDITSLTLNINGTLGGYTEQLDIPSIIETGTATYDEASRTYELTWTTECETPVTGGETITFGVSAEASVSATEASSLQPVINGTAPANSLVKIFEYDIETESVNLVMETNTDNSGLFTKQTDVSLETPGYHYLYAVSYDPATNETLGKSPVVELYIVPDSEPPVITFTSHIDGEFTNNNQPVIEAVITDEGSDATGVDWTTITCIAPVLCHIDQISGTDNVQLTLDSTLPEGESTITISASDIIGNLVSSDLRLIVDTLGPEITNAIVTPNPFSSAVFGTMSLSFVVSDPHPDAWDIEIWKDGARFRDISSGTNPNVYAEWDGTDDNGGALESGEYSVDILAIDMLNNDTHISIPILLDNGPPTADIRNPEINSYVSPTQYTAVFEVSDSLSGIDEDRVDVFLDGVFQGTGIRSGGSEFKYTLDFLGMDKQWKEISIVAYDKAGNHADASSRFYVSNVNYRVNSIVFKNKSRLGASDIAPGELFQAIIYVNNNRAEPQFLVVNSDRYDWPSSIGHDTGVDYEILIEQDYGSRTQIIGKLLGGSDRGGNSLSNINLVASVDGFGSIKESESLSISLPYVLDPPSIIYPRNNSRIYDPTPRIYGRTTPGTVVRVYLDIDGMDDILIGQVNSYDNGAGLFNIENSESIKPAGLKKIYAIAENTVTGQKSLRSEVVTITLQDSTRPEVTEYHIAPDVFSPEISIGSKDTTIISATIFDESLIKVRVQILGIDRRTVFLNDFQVSNADPVGPNYFEYEWDGLRHYPARRDGESLPDGKYRCLLTAYDSNNRGSVLKQEWVTKDSTPPVVKITEPLPNTPISGPAHKFVIYVNENIGLEKLELFLDTDYSDPIASAEYDIAADSYYAYVNADAIQNGPHKITAIALDRGGNTSVPHSVDVQVSDTDLFVDNLIATPDIFSPLNPAIGEVTIIASITGTDFSHWNISILNENAITVRSFSGSEMSVNLLWNGNDDSGVQVDNGVYTAELTAYNNDGDSFITSVNITMDDDKPEVQIIMPSDNDRVFQGNVQIEVAADDENGIEDVYLAIGNTTIVSNNVIDDLHYFNWSASRLPLGDYQIDATAIDRAGNVSIHTITITLVDTGTPMVEITSPQEDAVIYSEQWPVEVKYSVAAGRVRKIELYIDGTLNNTLSLPPLMGGIFVVNADLSNLNVGGHTLMCKAYRDIGGPLRIGVSNPLNVIIRPDIVSLSPETGAHNSTVAVYGSGFETDISQVSFDFNGLEAEVLSTTPNLMSVIVPGIRENSELVLQSTGGNVSAIPGAVTGSVSVTISGITSNTDKTFNVIGNTDVPSITIPADALLADTDITVTPMDIYNLPAELPEGVIFVGIAGFSPTDLLLSYNAEFYLPIEVEMIPGESVKIYKLDEPMATSSSSVRSSLRTVFGSLSPVTSSSTQDWIDTGIEGIVGPDGKSVTFEARELGRYAAAGKPMLNITSPCDSSMLNTINIAYNGSCNCTANVSYSGMPSGGYVTGFGWSGGSKISVSGNQTTGSIRGTSPGTTTLTVTMSYEYYVDGEIKYGYISKQREVRVIEPEIVNMNPLFDQTIDYGNTLSVSAQALPKNISGNYLTGYNFNWNAGFYGRFNCMSSCSSSQTFYPTEIGVSAVSVSYTYISPNGCPVTSEMISRNVTIRPVIVSLKEKSGASTVITNSEVVLTADISPSPARARECKWTVTGGGKIFNNTTYYNDCSNVTYKTPSNSATTNISLVYTRNNIASVPKNLNLSVEPLSVSLTPRNKTMSMGSSIVFTATPNFHHQNGIMTWSVTPSSAGYFSVNGETATFTPSDAGIFDIKAEYSIPDIGQKANDSTKLTVLPTVSIFPLSTEYLLLNTPISMGSNVNPEGGSYQWSASPANGSFNSVNNANPEFTGTNSGATNITVKYTYRNPDNNTTVEKTSEPVSVNIIDPSSVTVSVIAPESEEIGHNIPVRVSVFPPSQNGNYISWSSPHGTFHSNNGFSNVFIPNPDFIGKAQITAEYTYQGSNFPDTAVIDILPIITIQAPYFVSYPNIINLSVITTPSTLPGTPQYAWSFNPNYGNINNSNVSSPAFTPSNAGNVTFDLNVTVNSVTASATPKSVRVNPILGVDRTEITVLQGRTIKDITATGLPSGGSYSWIVSPALGTFSKNNTSNANKTDFTASTTTSGTGIIYVKYNTNTNIELSVNKIIAVKVETLSAEIGSGSTVAKGNAIDLKGAGNYSGGTCTWKNISGYTGEVAFQNINSCSTKLIGIQKGTAVFELTYKLDSLTAKTRKTVNVTDMIVNISPNPAEVTRGSQIQLTCMGEPQTSLNGMPGTYSWSIVSGQDYATILGSNSRKTVTIKGTNTQKSERNVSIAVEYTVNGAKGSATGIVTVFPISVTIDRPASFEVGRGGFITLKGNGQPEIGDDGRPGRYYWSVANTSNGDGEFSSSNENQTIFVGTDVGDVDVVLSYTVNGITETDTVELVVKEMDLSLSIPEPVTLGAHVKIFADGKPRTDYDFVTQGTYLWSIQSIGSDGGFATLTDYRSNEPYMIPEKQGLMKVTVSYSVNGVTGTKSETIRVGPMRIYVSDYDESISAGSVEKFMVTPFPLVGVDGVPGTYRWTTDSGSGRGRFPENDNRNPYFIGTVEGAVQVKLEYTVNGVTGEVFLPIEVTEMNLRIEPPAPSILIGQTVSMKGLGFPGGYLGTNVPGSYIWQVVSGDGIFTSRRDQQIVDFQGRSEGETVVKVEYTVNNVTGSENAKITTGTPNLLITGPDSISKGDHARLSLTGMPSGTSGTYSWTIESGWGRLSKYDIRDPIFVGTGIGIVTVKVDYTVGSVTLTARKSIDVTKMNIVARSTNSDPCIGEAFNLLASGTPARGYLGETGTYSWSIVSGDGSVKLPTPAIGGSITGIAQGLGSVTFRIMYFVNGVFDYEYVTVNVHPMKLSIFNPLEVTKGSHITLTATGEPQRDTNGIYGTYYWNIEGGDGGGFFLNYNKQNPTFVATREGEVNVCVRYTVNRNTGRECSKIKVVEMNLTLSSLPEDPLILTVGEHVQLNAYGQPVYWYNNVTQGTYYWYDLGANIGSFTKPSERSTIFIAERPGTASICLRYAVNTVYSKKCFDVVVNNMDITITPPDDTVLTKGSFMSVTAKGTPTYDRHHIPGTYTWTVSSNGGLSDSSNSTVNLLGKREGPVTLTAKYSVNGVTGSNSVKYWVADMPLEIISSAPFVNQGYGISLKVDATPSRSANGQPGTCVWSTISGSVNVQLTPHPTTSCYASLIGMKEGFATVQVRYTVNGVTETATKEIEVKAMPISILVDPDSEVHIGQSITLSGSVGFFGGTYKWSIVSPSSGSGIFGNSNAAVTTFYGTRKGQVKIKLTYTTPNGISVSTETSVEVKSMDIAITAGTENVEYDSTTQLNCAANPSNATSRYEWSIDSSSTGGGTFSNRFVSNPVFTATKVGTVVVKLEYSVSTISTFSDVRTYNLYVTPLQLQLSITQVTSNQSPSVPPTNTDHFVYDSTNPDGRLVLNLQGVITPVPIYQSDIRWSLNGLDASMFSWNPEDPNNSALGTGANPVLTLIGLPTDNAEFGQKQIEIKIDNDNLAASPVTTNIELFFTHDATNHPGGTVGAPNWFNYWSEALGANYIVWDNNISISCPGTISACTLVRGATDWTTWVGPGAFWAPPGNPTTNEEYINGFLGTIEHERGHRIHRIHNFIVHGAWSPSAAEDIDGDNICDREPGDPPGHTGGWEAAYGLDPNVPNTTHEIGDILERRAIYNRDSWDWSSPGSQW